MSDFPSPSDGIQPAPEMLPATPPPDSPAVLTSVPVAPSAPAPRGKRPVSFLGPLLGSLAGLIIGGIAVFFVWTNYSAQLESADKDLNKLQTALKKAQANPQKKLPVPDANLKILMENNAKLAAKIKKAEADLRDALLQAKVQPVVKQPAPVGKQPAELQKLRRDVFDLQLAQAALMVEKDHRTALALLHDNERCPVELRDFTWHMLNGSCQDVRARINQAPADGFNRDTRKQIRSWAFSADSKTLLTTFAPTADAPVRFALVDTGTGGQGFIREVSAKGEPVFGRENSAIDCILSPDGKVVATASKLYSAMPEIRLSDASSGKLIGKLEGNNPHLGFGGNMFVTADVNPQLRVFTPDGKAIITSIRDDVLFWDCATGKKIRTIKAAGWPVIFSPDGKSLLTLRAKEDPNGPGGQIWGEESTWQGIKKVCRVDLASGEIRDLFETSLSARPMVSADAATLVAWTAPASVKVWDVAQAKLRLEFLPGTNARWLQLSPDGTALASHGYSPGGNEPNVVLWDLTTGKQRATLNHGKEREVSVLVHTFSHDGKTLASGDNKYVVRLWDVATGTLQATLNGQSAETGGPNGIRALAFSPDGRMLFSVAQEMILWTTPQGRAPVSLRYASPEKEPSTDQHAAFMAYSPDGATLLTCNGGKWLDLWDTASGRHRAALKGHSGTVSAWAMSADGKLLASGDDKDIRLWDVASGKERAVVAGFKDRVLALAFGPSPLPLSPKGERGKGEMLFAGFHDGSLRLVDVAGAKFVADDMDKNLNPIRETHKDSVRSLAFNFEGNLIVYTIDGLVCCWETFPMEKRPDGKMASGPAQQLFGERIPVQDGRFRLYPFMKVSPDGKFVALVNERKVVVLDAATGKERGVLPYPERGLTDGVPLAFGSDSKSVVAGDRTGKIRILDLVTGQVRETAKGGNVILRQASALVPGDPPNPYLANSHQKEFKVHLQFGKNYLVDVIVPPGHKLEPKLDYIAGNTHHTSVAVGDGGVPHARYMLQPKASLTHTLIVTSAGSGQTGPFEITVTEVYDSQWPGSYVRTLAVSPDGKTLISGGGQAWISPQSSSWVGNGEVRFFDALGGQECAVQRVQGGLVTATAFAPDGQTLAVLTQDGTVHLLNGAPAALPMASENAIVALAEMGAKFTGAGNTVTGVSLYEVKLKDADLVHLKEFKRLQTLNLLNTHSPFEPARFPGLTSASLINLKDLQDLRVLKINGPRITDAGVAQLKDLKNLQELTLSGTGLTDAGLIHLAHLKNLEYLDIDNTKVTDEGLAHLKDLKNLKYLDLSGGSSKVTAAGLAHLAGLKNLTTLNVPVSDSTVRKLRELGLLHAFAKASGKDKTRPKSADDVIELDLSFTPVTNEALKELAGLKNLASLNLANTKVTDEGLKHLAGLQKLATLSIYSSQLITEKGLKELAGLKNLTGLNLDAAQLTDGMVRTLKEIGLLQTLPAARGKDGARAKTLDEILSLDLAHSKVTDDVLKDIAGLKNLVTLNLGNTQITGSGLKELTELKNLADLTVGGPKFTDAGVKELAGLKHLTTLNLGKITDTTLRTLREIGRLHTLAQATAKDGARPKSMDDVVALRLWNTKISGAGLKELAGLTNLADLSFKTDAAAESVKELAPLKKLVNLRIADSKQINNATLRSLREIGLLHTLANITRGKNGSHPKTSDEVIGIDLKGMPVTGEGLKELTGFKNLETISVDASALTDASLHVLLEAGLLHTLDLARGSDFKRPKSTAEIVSLQLSGPDVTDACLKDLKGLKNLATLNLHEPKVTDATLKALRELGLLHVYSGASGKDFSRPKSAGDVISLTLNYTKMTDAGLKELTGLKKLATLHLIGAPVKDDGLVDLKEFKELTDLHLGGTAVTDAGVAHLETLTSLRELHLPTKVTDTAVKYLRTALPDCKISR